MYFLGYGACGLRVAAEWRASWGWGVESTAAGSVVFALSGSAPRVPASLVGVRIGSIVVPFWHYLVGF